MPGPASSRAPCAIANGCSSQRADQYACQAPGRISRRDADRDHALVREPRGDGFAYERLPRGHHVPEVGAIGEVHVLRDRTPLRGRAREALGVGPAESTAERDVAARLDALEVALHGRGVAAHDRRRARDRCERGDLASEVDVDHAAGKHGAGALVAESGRLRVLVLAPCETARRRDEDEHREERSDREVPAVADAATRQRVGEFRALARSFSRAGSVGHARPGRSSGISNKPLLTLVEQSPGTAFPDARYIAFSRSRRKQVLP